MYKGKLTDKKQKTIIAMETLIKGLKHYARKHYDMPLV